MITQTFKRWMKRLFAWWPGKRSTGVQKRQLAVSTGYNSTSETLWHMMEATTGLTFSQQSMSIAIEQEMPDASLSVLEPGKPSGDMHESPVARSTDSDAQSRSLSIPPVDTYAAATRERSARLSPAECHLIFLRYLFEHGMLNEGFISGEVPAQYRPRARKL